MQMTIAEGLEKYRQTVSIFKKGYAQEAYRIASIQRSSLGSLQMSSAKSPAFAHYRDLRMTQSSQRTGKPVGPSTVRAELSLLSNLFDIGRIEWGVCSDNPVTNVRKPKPRPGRDRRLLPREERMILRYCKSHPSRDLRSLVILALETAMRMGELLSLTWDNVNLRVGIAHLPDTKNGSKRDVPLSPRAREEFKAMGVKTTGRVFSYTANGLKSAWRTMTLRLDIKDLHFHDLRHEACSRLFELNRLDVMEVAAISGHKSLSQLKRYTHLKAARLVKKLEGNRDRGRQYLLNYLVPYPSSSYMNDDGVYFVRVLDFDDVYGVGSNELEALANARSCLLQAIMLNLRDGKKNPVPDQYLDEVDTDSIIMLDPLPATS